jgi:RNA-binding protein YlmH
MLLIVDENSIDTRLDVFLSQLYDGISRSKIQSAIKDGKVLVNGETRKPSY